MTIQMETGNWQRLRQKSNNKDSDFDFDFDNDDDDDDDDDGDGIEDSLCTDRPSPQKKNRRGKVCDLPLVIVFRNNFAFII